MSNLSPRTQWLALNRMANIYKTISFVLGGCLLFSLCILAYTTTLAPIVITKENGNIQRVQSKRENVIIQDEEIKNFVKDFIKQHYEWKKMNDPSRLQKIKPFVTDDFYRLLTKNLAKLKKMDDVSQYVGDIKVSVSKEAILAQFDKIVRLKGLPLVSVTQISLQIIKDSPNKWNPLGLYVNGLIEHEEK